MERFMKPYFYGRSSLSIWKMGLKENKYYRCVMKHICNTIYNIVIC